MKFDNLLSLAPFSGTRVKPFAGEKKYLSTGAVQNEGIEFENVTYKNKPSRADIVVSEGDIIFARMKGTNKVLYIDENLSGVIVSTGFSVHKVNKDKAVMQYIEQILKGEMFNSAKDKLCTGSTQAAITNEGLSKIMIPAPSIAEQIRIADVLSRAESLIAKRKETIKMLDEYLKSVFLDMFGDPVRNEKGWVYVELKNLYIDEKNGTKCGPFGSALKKHEYIKSGVPVWNMDNISLKGEVVEPFNLWISDEKYLELKAYSVINGDVIVSRAGTVGKMCVANSNFDKSIISTNLIRVRLGKMLLPEYFVSLMLYCKDKLGRLKKGAEGTFTHMNTGILDNIKFPYPPMELQNKYVAILRNIKMLNVKYNNNLLELEDMLDSLVKEIF